MTMLKKKGRYYDLGKMVGPVGLEPTTCRL